LGGDLRASGYKDSNNWLAKKGYLAPFIEKETVLSDGSIDGAVTEEQVAISPQHLSSFDLLFLSWQGMLQGTSELIDIWSSQIGLDCTVLPIALSANKTIAVMCKHFLSIPNQTF